MSKQPVKASSLRVRTDIVLSDAIEKGVQLGYRRAHKHTDKPDEYTLCDLMEIAVRECIHEVFDIVLDTRE